MSTRNEDDLDDCDLQKHGRRHLLCINPCFPRDRWKLQKSVSNVWRNLEIVEISLVAFRRNSRRRCRSYSERGQFRHSPQNPRNFDRHLHRLYHVPAPPVLQVPHFVHSGVSPLPCTAVGLWSSFRRRNAESGLVFARARHVATVLLRCRDATLEMFLRRWLFSFSPDQLSHFPQTIWTRHGRSKLLQQFFGRPDANVFS